MSVICNRTFSLGLVLATTLLVSVASAHAQGYTAEQQQACTSDAFQFCGPEIPDIQRVTACMVRNKARLSPACRAQFRAPVASTTRKARKKPVRT